MKGNEKNTTMKGNEMKIFLVLKLFHLNGLHNKILNKMLFRDMNVKKLWTKKMTTT